MLFADTKVIQMGPAGFAVEWRWDPQGCPVSPDLCELDVQRSEGPDGPWDLVETVRPRDVFSVLDKTTPWRSQSQSFYFRLRVIEASTGEELGASDPFNAHHRLSRVAEEILRQQRILTEGVNGHAPAKGVLATIYRRRSIGPPCRLCRDAVSGAIHVGNCLACVGTGIVGGYYNPVTVGFEIGPEIKQRRWGNIQPTEDNKTQGKMNNYPSLFSGDIIVEPNEKHWRVDGVQVTEEKRVTVRQAPALVPTKPDDIVNRILRHRDNGGRRDA